MLELNSIEERVVEKLLEGADPTLFALRQQFATLSFAGRRGSGIGFFVTFASGTTTEPLPGSPNFELGDVMAKSDKLPRDAGFILFVRNGLIESLEGYAFEGAWPSEIENFFLEYSNDRRNDLSALDQISPRKQY